MPDNSIFSLKGIEQPQYLVDKINKHFKKKEINPVKKQHPVQTQVIVSLLNAGRACAIQSTLISCKFDNDFFTSISDGVVLKEPEYR